MAIDPTAIYQASDDPDGTDFLNQYYSFVGSLVDTAVLRLTNVAGTDAITADAEPFEVASTGLVAGMKFTFVPAANNTGAATLNIDGRGAESIVNGDGSGLNADDLADDTRYLIEFDGTNFVIMFRSASSTTATASRTTYDTSTSWSNTFPANTIVKVELWGGGAGGYSSQSGRGGGGGAYAVAEFSASDLPGSVTITIAGNAAAETDGGTSSFGSFLSAYGGEAGELDTGSPSGGAGGTPFGTGGATVAGDGPGGIYEGGTGGDGGNPGTDGQGSVYGGGGGGGYDSGGATVKSGGLSIHGGAGGDGDGSAGERPGGGGGVDGGAGGAGRCIITIYGA